MPSFRSFDNTEVYYDLRGQGTPALIFVHGWCCNRSFWSEQVDYFAKSHTVVTLDLAGHGNSGKGNRDWTMQNYGRDVAAVWDAVDADEAILIGHSSGGAVILEAARLIPDGIIGLVGVDAYVYPLYSRLSQSEIDNLVRPLETDFANFVQGYAGNLLHPDSPRELANRIGSVMSRTPPSVAIPSVRSLYEWDFRETVKDIDIPVTCIYSADHTAGIDLRLFEPYFSLRRMEGVGHFPMMEKPVEFNRVLQRIITDGSNDG